MQDIDLGACRFRRRSRRLSGSAGKKSQARPVRTPARRIGIGPVRGQSPWRGSPIGRNYPDRGVSAVLRLIDDAENISHLLSIWRDVCIVDGLKGEIIFGRNSAISKG